MGFRKKIYSALSIFFPYFIFLYKFPILQRPENNLQFILFSVRLYFHIIFIYNSPKRTECSHFNGSRDSVDTSYNEFFYFILYFIFIVVLLLYFVVQITIFFYY